MPRTRCEIGKLHLVSNANHVVSVFATRTKFAAIATISESVDAAAIVSLALRQVKKYGRLALLRAEDNRFLTESGSGTAMGELLRRFWIPVLLSEELPEADGAPKKIVVATIPVGVAGTGGDIAAGGRAGSQPQQRHQRPEMQNR